ncbi:unnamed protein product [Meganyctiphanes norvegica]|uniref:BTB domain-containing protein n=1 Tax=Meganyctiphanes norvegica TaxID=48144 RepID=A0AAV2RML1_MEGNR
MGTQQCLRWKDFHTNISTAFVSLRDDEEFVDITLACEGKQIKAHKMVLSACSPYFENILKGNPCQHPIVFLKDVTFDNLKSILDFMYHGEVDVPETELAIFLKIAEELKVKGLGKDEKKNESESNIEACSPLSTRDPPDPGLTSLREEVINKPDTHISEFPLRKRLRIHSGEPSHSTEKSNEMVQDENRQCSVKDESLDLTDENADLLVHGNTKSIKHETDDNSEEGEIVPCETETINQNQSAMQQLQTPFGSFLPGKGQIPHGSPQTVIEDQVGHIPIGLTKRGRCRNVGCKSVPVFYCMKCKVYLCIGNGKNCFAGFHGVQMDLADFP